MQELLRKLNIDETFTRPIRNNLFSKVKETTILKPDYNFMADLLFLPKTKLGNNYLLTVVDLATNECDFEPIKDKEAETTLIAIKKIFKRPHLNEPYASIRTDNGKEFKGVFSKWMYNESILHRIAEPYRHQQLANVENLNRTLGRLLNGYMNQREELTGEVYKEWDSPKILNLIRKDLNEFRKQPVQDIHKIVYKLPDYTKTAKYKVDDLVYRAVEIPKNALGNNQNTHNFREGDYRWDKVPRKIVRVLAYPPPVHYRYILDTLPHVSFSENQLMKAKETQEKFIIKEIIDRKVEKKIIYYKVWWKNSLKKNATWESKTKLIEDGAKSLIDAYESTR